MLRQLAHLVDARPTLLVLLCLVPGFFLGAMAFRAPVDFTFLGILNRSQPEVARYLKQSERLGFGGTLIVLLESKSSAPDVALDRGVALLKQALKDHPEVAGVIEPVSREWILQQLLWLLPSHEFDRVTASLEQINTVDGSVDGSAGVPAESSVGTPSVSALDVASMLSSSEWSRALEEIDQRLGSVGFSNERILQVRLHKDPLTEAFGNSTYLELLALIEEALADSDVTFELSGLPAVAAQDQGRTLSTIRRLSPLSLLVVVLLVFLVERRWRILLAVLAALLLAVAATVGLIGWLAGGLTLMETFFGVTVFGLGIDFAIHLLLRLKEERLAGRSAGEALQRALGGTGRGIIAGAVTTAGAFLVVALAPDPVALHLGLSGGIGLGFCLVFMLILVPVAWRRAEQASGGLGGVSNDEASEDGGLEHRGPDEPDTPSVWLLGLGRLPRIVARHAVEHPWRHLGGAVALLVLALAGTPRFALESRLEKVFNRDVPAVATVNDIRERFGVSGAPWVLPAGSLAEAEQIALALRARPETFASVSSPSDVLSVDSRESSRRAHVLTELHPALHQALGPLSFAAALSGEDSDLSRLLELARAFDVGMEQGPPTEASLPLGLQLLFRGVGSSGGLASVGVGAEGDRKDHWLVYAYGRESTFDARLSKKARLVAQEISPDATGISALLEAVLLGPRPWVWKVGLAVVLFVALVLVVDLRNLRWIVLALLPVALGSGVTFGLLCWLPMNFNVMTVMVVPLLFGLGVDDGIHVVHRMREGRESLADATGAVGRAILMTTATTCASFAILLFTNHPGLESMAIVMLVGMPLCLLASVSSLPAAAHLLDAGQGGRETVTPP